LVSIRSRKWDYSTNSWQANSSTEIAGFKETDFVAAVDDRGLEKTKNIADVTDVGYSTSIYILKF
jgi:hypothetical protein